MLELIEQILRRCDAGEAFAVCTLVAARGSTPQKPPAMMVVLADGQTLGTIGGGCVEAEVRSRALRQLADSPSSADIALSTFQLDQDFGWDDGLVCGGTMDVAIHVSRSPGDAAPFKVARHALRSGQPAALSIVVTDTEGDQRVFNLAIDPRPVLVIAGAGHVGAALAEIARRTDFTAVVIDDRPDLNNPASLPGATCIVGPIDDELAKYPIDANTYVVIVTRGHRNDASALAAVVGSPARYIGLIGSKRKIVTIYEDLLQKGIPLERLKTVHAPIGLDIGAVTPAEIAVSIAAELIAVRRQGDAKSSMRLATSLLARIAQEPSTASIVTDSVTPECP